ncbi:MAG: DUF501 domain-containing protein [Acidobacteria bacterium]|nr:DUF501 domain-containing protein [Acidobacteriota bacterium]
MAWRQVPFLGDPVDRRERGLVACQLGRDPRGEIAIAVRCVHGLPAVVRTSGRLEDGTPFPTLYYLVCPVAVRAAGGLEASGRMRRYEARLRDDAALAAEYRRAHERYIERRESLRSGGAELPGPASTVSAGGMPARVKCLHALVAHDLAESNPIGRLARQDIGPLSCPGPCCPSDPRGDRGRR